LALKVNPLALEVVVDDFLLLADHLGLAGDFLQQDLHHVHLAEAQVLHLGDSLLSFSELLGWLHLPQICGEHVRGIVDFSSAQNSTDFSRVERHHGIGSERETLVDLAAGHL